MNRAPIPSMRTRISAVATSCRALRPNAPMPSAPATENTARPTRVLAPIRLAPAAPAKAPLGMAWAAKVEPRSTAKKPTTPAMTATMLPAIQVFIMKPLNMARRRPPARARPGRDPGGRGPPPGARGGGGGGGGAGGAAQVGEQVGQDNQGHDEEAHRPGVAVRRPVVAVVGEQGAEPGDDHADRGRGDHGPDRALGDPQRGGGRPDQQRGAEHGPDGHRGQ